MAPALAQRYRDLEARMRAWPRTRANDPFHAASTDLAARLARARAVHREVEFVYAWPFEEAAVIRLLAEQIGKAAG